MSLTRLKYQNCSLHDEPLNYLCLNANCIDDRIICAICKQERHSQSHLTIPLKIYLIRKTQQLKCLTQTKLESIQVSLYQQKQKILRVIHNIREQINGKIQALEYQCQKFYTEKVNSLNQCWQMINNDQLQISNMQSFEQTIKTVLNYTEYEQQMNKKLIQIKDQVAKLVPKNFFTKDLAQKRWQGHSQILLKQNILISKQNGYKVALLSKPITKIFNKATFRIIRSVKNWITFGVCKKKVVKNNKFNFKYFTLGHGVYALSSNGAIWSHDHTEFNNRLGGLQFSHKDQISIYYDFNQHKVWFQSSSKQKFSLEVDQRQGQVLNFCAILYHQGDRAQFIPQLSFIN